MRVFSLSDLVERRIPRPGQFEEVVRICRHSFATLEKDFSGNRDINGMHFLGGVLIGSIARQVDASCTSDIDIVVFYDDVTIGNPSARMFAAETYRSYYVEALVTASRYNIPVNIYNVFLGKIKNKESKHTKQFLHHVVSCMSGEYAPRSLLAGTAVGIMRVYDAAPSLSRKDMIDYFIAKQEKFEDAWFSWGGLSHDKAVTFLSQACTTPFHGARKLLDVLSVGYVDTKEGVLEALKTVLGTKSEPFFELHSICATYAKECDLLQKGSITQLSRSTLNPSSVYHESSHALQSLREFGAR